MFSFIRQPSFAKYVMVDILYATRELGWEILWVDLEQFVEENRSKTDREIHQEVERLLQNIEDFDPDLVFSYGLEYLSPVFQEILPSLNAPFSEVLKRPGVFFLFDFGFPFDTPWVAEKREFGAKLQTPEYIFFCWDRHALNIMRDFGLTKSFYLPMAVNEKAFYKALIPEGDQNARRDGIIFVGGPTEERIAYLTEVAEFGLKIFGYGEKQWKSSPELIHCYLGTIKDRDTLRQRYNKAKISVNITRPHGFASLNMRVFEAMACGGLMLTDDKSDAGKLYKEGEEIVICTSKDDLKKKTAFFLKHDKERERVAEAGRQRTLEEHTYLVRMKKALPTIVQFLKELAVFRRIEKVAKNDPAVALSLLGEKEIRDFINHNVDNYYFEMAKLNSLCQEHAAIKNNIDRALTANPSHVGAKAMKDYFV